MTTRQQADNAAWMIDAIASNAKSFDYDVAGYWDAARHAIAAFAIDEDKHRADVGDDGIAVIEALCKTGDYNAAVAALDRLYE
jgi:hypothetical protein